MSEVEYNFLKKCYFSRAKTKRRNESEQHFRQRVNICAETLSLGRVQPIENHSVWRITRDGRELDRMRLMS